MPGGGDAPDARGDGVHVPREGPARDDAKSEVSGSHGGGDNSLTRLVIKPTHMIGGYAQLSYGFNYYGPTGNQRDEITVIRRRSQQVQY